MTVTYLDDRKAANQRRKADALRVTVKDQAGDVADTPDGLRLLAKAVWEGRDHHEMWANLAALADVRPPGSSYVAGRDLPGEKYRTISLVAAGLRQDADDLELEQTG